MTKIIDFAERLASRPATVHVPTGGTAEIKKLPYDVSRRIHSRKPRRSKNGTPEERAAKAAQEPAAPRSGNIASVTSRGGDPAYLRIAEHREAMQRYDRAVEAYCLAETQGASRVRLNEIDEEIGPACDAMFEAARLMLLDKPTTARGLARLAAYVRCLCIEADGGSPYIPDKINGKPWLLVFLPTVAHSSRRIGRKQNSDFVKLVQFLRGYLNQEVARGRPVDHVMHELIHGTAVAAEQ